MNGKERMKSALSLGKPDRVPHWELAYNESSVLGIARHFTDDLPAVDFIQRMTLDDKIRLFDAAVLVVTALDVDGLTLRLFPEARFIDEIRYVDDWGVTFQLDRAGEATVRRGPVADEADLKNFKPPKVKEADLLGLAYAAEKIGADRAVVLSLQCPFRRSWNILGGMAHLLLAYMQSPGLVHALARISTDYTLEAIELGIKLGADIISLDGDLAHNTNTLISPQHFREYIKPYYTEIVDYAHERNMLIFKHTDGDHSKITEDLLETGINGIHPIQPQCLNIRDFKREYGQRVCIMGNIDCVKTLVSKGPEDVEAEVKKTIAAAAAGGGYILSSSNTIHPGVKPENYIAMVHAAHKYGKYDN
jgi:uroporphyrinogen decarboxylase